ncbi:MAG: MFS transporter [Anderseniella sp.]|nr:MFS transporter [Anderseniella sp.]
MSDDFVPPYSKGVFRLRAFALLCCFSMTTSQALLPVVMSDYGISQTSVGYAMSTTGISVLIFGVVSGLFISRFGALAGVVSGTAIMLVAHLSFGLVSPSEWSVTVSRFVHGIGAGMGLPAAMAFATVMLQGKNATAYFGIFTSMIAGANLIGPPLGEWYLSTYGADGYFIVTAVPGVVSLVIFIGLLFKFGSTQMSRKSNIHYFSLLKRSDLQLPFIGLLVIGSFWGYVISFISVAFADKGLAVSLFFIPMTCGLFFGRFVGLKLARSYSNHAVALTAVVLTATALFATSTLSGDVVSVVAGAVFGLGYSLAYPTLSMWISNSVTEEIRGQAVALTNTIFNVVMFGAPAVCAFWIGYITILSYQFWLSLVLGLAAVLVFSLAKVTRDSSEPK